MHGQIEQANCRTVKQSNSSPATTTATITVSNSRTVFTGTNSSPATTATTTVSNSRTVFTGTNTTMSKSNSRTVKQPKNRTVSCYYCYYHSVEQFLLAQIRPCPNRTVEQSPATTTTTTVSNIQTVEQLWPLATTVPITVDCCLLRVSIPNLFSLTNSKRLLIESNNNTKESSNFPEIII